MNKFVFLFLSLIPVLVRAQEPYPANVYIERPQKGIFHLKGKVKVLQEGCFKYDINGKDTLKTHLRELMTDYDFKVSFNERGNKIEQVFYAPSGKVRDHYEFFYDDKGQLVKEWTSKKSWKFKDHLLVDSAIYFISKKHDYDSHGKITHTETFTGDSIKIKEPNPALVLHENFKYDKAGRKTECISSRGKYFFGKYFYKYDTLGRLVQVSESTLSDRPSQIDIYKYDKNGNCVEIDSKGNINGKQLFTYQNSRMASEEWYYPNGKFQDKKIISRDKEENITEIVYQDESGKTTRTKTSVYKYDQNGNWIKQEMYINGLLRFVFTRTIEYY